MKPSHLCTHSPQRAVDLCQHDCGQTMIVVLDSGHSICAELFDVRRAGDVVWVDLDLEVSPGLYATTTVPLPSHTPITFGSNHAPTPIVRLA